MKCKQCGETIPNRVDFCTKCGSKVEKESVWKNKIVRRIANILFVVLGAVALLFARIKIQQHEVEKTIHELVVQCAEERAEQTRGNDISPALEIKILEVKNMKLIDIGRKKWKGEADVYAVSKLGVKIRLRAVFNACENEDSIEVSECDFVFPDFGFPD